MFKNFSLKLKENITHEAKAVPVLAMKAFGRRGGIAPTHS
jgi:hypothetical protein